VERRVYVRVDGLNYQELEERNFYHESSYGGVGDAFPMPGANDSNMWNQSAWKPSMQRMVRLCDARTPDDFF
jgi:hypothetical protein